MTAVTADVVVVGSGATGAVAAAALRRAGRDVLLIDTGHDLDPTRRDAIDRMSRQLPQEWADADRAKLQYKPEPGSGLGAKLWFGSDAVYAPAPALPVSSDGVGLQPSFARGGLTNVWGATMLPYRDDVIRHWPDRVRRELPAGYARVAELVPVSGADGPELTEYPFHGPKQPALRLSSLGSALLHRARRQRSRLERADVVVGQSRLAMRSAHPAPGAGCIYCGHCVQGCVYGHIWSARQLVDRLQREGLRLLDATVQRWRETPDGVDVEALDADGAALTVRADRVLVAAGPVLSAALAQRSGTVDGPVRVRDSQTVFLPMLYGGRTGGVVREPGYTLSQLWLDLPGPVRADQRSQLQLYTWNSSLVDRARALKPALGALPEPLLRAGLARVVTGIGYLHSADSSSLQVATRDGVTHLSALPAPDLRATLATWWRQLARQLTHLGLLPVPPLAEVTAPGGGYHVGASLPMREDGGDGHSSDLLGRPSGSRRVHVVDASVLPDIPAGAVTYTAMANAWRIAEQVCAR